MTATTTGTGPITTDNAHEPARYSRRYIETALDTAERMMRYDRWRVVGVRPDGIVLKNVYFGKPVQRYVCASSTGAP